VPPVCAGWCVWLCMCVRGVCASSMSSLFGVCLRDCKPVVYVGGVGALLTSAEGLWVQNRAAARPTADITHLTRVGSNTLCVM
jgi:hypothetical protein